MVKCKQMEVGFHKRTILLLEELQGDVALKEYVSILESPLGLAKIVIGKCFDRSNEGLKSFRDDLDSIKLMSIGLGSASKAALAGDSLANYSLYQFAFQQFFQSSARARQGTILDKALAKILAENGVKIFEKAQHGEALSALGVQTSARHDIDVFGIAGDISLIVQIRSRDDTGGTTAKGSLVELLEDIKRAGKFPQNDLVYLVYVWEPLAEQQRQALVNKIVDALELSGEERGMLRGGEVVSIGNNIYLGVIYGPKELFEITNDVLGIVIDAEEYGNIIGKLGEWDDLWLSYSLATLEMQRLIDTGTTNFNVLEEILSQQDMVIDQSKILDYRESSINMAQNIALAWEKSTIPFSSPADQLNYIRDLVLLKMAHIAVTGGGVARLF